MVLYSVDFAEIEVLQCAGNWDGAAAEMALAAQRVAAAGADCLLLCTNTMHKVAEYVASSISIPLLHIADITAKRLIANGFSRVGLLGTRFTMEQDFYRERLASHGLRVIVPNASDRAVVHSVIYEELCRGDVLEKSRREYQRVIKSLGEHGAEAVVLGCTEIGRVVGQHDSHVPLFDTTRIHPEAAVAFALGEERP